MKQRVFLERAIMESKKPNCPLETGLRPCMCDLPRCPVCGYTKHDAQFEGDHFVCIGKISKREREIMINQDEELGSAHSFTSFVCHDRLDYEERKG